MSDYRPPGFQLIPTVIKNLLIINILFMLAGMRFGEVMDHYFSLHRVSSDLFMPHQFITHMFMHGNNSHLFFNMFALWMFGSLLERRPVDASAPESTCYHGNVSRGWLDRDVVCRVLASLCVP